MTILKPIISEKSMREAASGKFTFAVHTEADKKTIREAVEKRFKVNVTSLVTSKVKGRTKRAGTRRIESVQTAWKKAVVSLKSGQKIDLFELGS